MAGYQNSAMQEYLFSSCWIIVLRLYREIITLKEHEPLILWLRACSMNLKLKKEREREQHLATHLEKSLKKYLLREFMVQLWWLILIGTRCPVQCLPVYQSVHGRISLGIHNGPGEAEEQCFLPFW